MPKKGNFPAELIRIYFARLYHQCKFIILNHDETIAFLLQYRARLKEFQKGEGKQKAVPKGKEGLQVVLRAKVKKFYIYILTTVDWSTGTIKEIDEGWVFIVDIRTGKVCFYHKPLHRTENYFDKLSAVAEAEVHRCATMPSCPECKHLYSIELIKLYGEFAGEYGYKIDCPNKTFKHKHPTSKNFYEGMDPLHKEVIEKGFEEYHKYRLKNPGAKSSREIRAKKTAREPNGIHLEEIYNDGAHAE